jgi:hypothetical protein
MFKLEECSLPTAHTLPHDQNAAAQVKTTEVTNNTKRLDVFCDLCG